MLLNRRCLILQEGDDTLLEVALLNHDIGSKTLHSGAADVPPLAVRLQILSCYFFTSLIYRSPEMVTHGLLMAAPQTNRLVNCVWPLIEILEWFSAHRPHQLSNIVVSAPVGASMETVVFEQFAVLKAFTAGTTCHWRLVEPPDSIASPSSIAEMISCPPSRPALLR